MSTLSATFNLSIKLVICFSGKRKSGKDFVCTRFSNMLNSMDLKSEIRGVSFPLKEEYAKLHTEELDIEKMKSNGDYKEKYRKDMVEFGEKIRIKDPWYFCRKTMESISPFIQIVMISDCRRPSDIAYFRQNYPTLTIRVHSPIEIREKRGYSFTPGIDNAETECALDEFQNFDILLENGDDELHLDKELKNLLNIVINRIKL